MKLNSMCTLSHTSTPPTKTSKGLCLSRATHPYESAMGQLWRVIAHERLEELENWGKAGEWVPTPWPLELIPRLVVPVDVDITVNPITPSSIFLGSTKISSPNESTGKHHTHHESTAPAGSASNCNSTRSEYQRPSTQLPELPIEVFCLITNELDLNSLYALSHCSRELRNILHPEIHVRFRRILAPWANTPLICAGDYMESNPPGIETRVPEGFTSNLPEGENENQNYSNYSVYEFMNLLDPTNVTREESFCPPTLNPIPVKKNIPWDLRPRHSPWARMLKLQQYFPAGRRWVLRNLTQKEYVYVHQLTSKDGHGGGIDRPDGEHLWGFNLGTVVAVNTCWSDDPSASMSDLDFRGCWAGNCFDIVVEEKLREDMKAYNGWKNVSLREWRKMVDLFIVNDWNIQAQ